MQELSPIPIPWPGFSAQRAFVLPLSDELMGSPFAASLELDGIRLQRKREFHVTVLSREMAGAAAAALSEPRLRALYDTLNWIPQRTGHYTLLHEDKRTHTGVLACWSLIEHLHFPAMLAFRAELTRALGLAFADPVPHVTHYVHGDPNGIGVPDRRALQAKRVREVLP